MHIFFTLVSSHATSPYITNSLFSPISISLFIEFDADVKMELELGLKLTNLVDDDFAAAELLIAKDRAGPLFLSTQTESTFFITAHLRGYRRKSIKIDINDDGSRMEISGEKPVQEMAMVGWQVLKKEVEMRGFRKSFIIPSGVNLDEIKARFDEDESVLTISMPKLVKGLTGVGIQELKETETTQLVATEEEESSKPQGVKVQEIDQKVEDVPDQAQLELERKEIQDVGSSGSDPKKLEGERGHGFSEKMETDKKETETVEPTGVERVHVTQPKELPSPAPVLDEERPPDKGPLLEKVREEKGTQTAEEITRDIQETEKPENDQVEPICLKQPSDETKVVQDQELGRTEESIPEEKEKEAHDQSTDKCHRRKIKKICQPGIIVGSSLLVSLVVLVIHLIRSNNQTSKKRS